MKHKLFILVGPSGVGKKTIQIGLGKYLPFKLATLVSATTRKSRKNEIDSVDYYFLSEESFLNYKKNDKFVETKKFTTAWYGTLKEELSNKLQENHSLAEVEVTGAFAIKRLYPEATTIFILPPAFKDLQKRITERQNDMSKKDLDARLAVAAHEIQLRDQFDYFLVNKDIEETRKAIAHIIMRIVNP